MTASDLSVFFQAHGCDSKRIRLIVHNRSNPETRLKEFKTPLEAFYFAEREPDLDFAELWQNGSGLCQLRKIKLPSGNIWQIGPFVEPIMRVAGVGQPAIGAALSNRVLRPNLLEELQPRPTVDHSS